MGVEAIKKNPRHCIWVCNVPVPFVESYEYAGWIWVHRDGPGVMRGFAKSAVSEKLDLFPIGLDQRPG